MSEPTPEREPETSRIEQAGYARRDHAMSTGWIYYTAIPVGKITYQLPAGVWIRVQDARRPTHDR